MHVCQIGVSNILGSFVSAYPVTGSFSRYSTAFSSYNVNNILDVDVDVEDLRAQANASMPASYIAN